jgi:competence ComEA-like helix-hairpin-helix protein
LREVLERVAAAEERAQEAERRARDAEARAASSIRATEELGGTPPPQASAPPPPPASDPTPPAPPQPPEASASQPPPISPPAPREESVEEAGQEEGEEAGEEEGGGILGRTVGAILGVGPGREAPEEEHTVEPAPERKEFEELDVSGNAQRSGDRINLNSASFEELRELGFSVTQATRVITYRERQNGFDSVDDLAEVPGMPPDFLGDVKGKLTL